VTNCTETALHAAMAQGGTVTFACNGTITLTSTITNDLDVTLDGTGHQVTISASGNPFYGGPLFQINTNVHFKAVNLAICAAWGGAILNLGGSVSLSGVALAGNQASDAGGGAILNQGGTVNATDCSFTGNLAPGGNGTPSGGAILNRGGTVNATNCSFTGNLAGQPFGSTACGGAIRNETGEVNLSACSFAGNQANRIVYQAYYYGHAQGGAIHNSGTLMVDLCTFTGNSASAGDGGSGSSYYGANPSGTPGASGAGGAIYNQGTLTVDRTTFSGNSATGGSGGSGASGSQAGPGGDGGGGCGGAIYGYGSVSRSLFTSNSVTGGAGGAGGGIAYDNYFGTGCGGGNGGAGLGGAVCGGGSLVNCTIAFNAARGRSGGDGHGSGWGDGGNGGGGGSGVAAVSGGSLVNCTLVGNLGQAGSGGQAGSSIHNNKGVPGTNGTSSVSTASASNTLMASNTPAGGDTFADPKLGPLADNGGPTLTMALLPGSPAIDAGNTSLAPATDQRGFPRPAGWAADIGAFEYGSVMPTLTISRSGATGLNILTSGNANQPCRLLMSMDLSSWAPIATNQIGGGGTVLFYDTLAPGGACRFYRLVMP
jgi:hypothetical protein